MKIVTIAFLLLSISTFVIAAPAKTLEDMPKHWAGKAGDIFQTVDASLTIDSLTLERKDENDGILVQDYIVKAHFVFGNNLIPIKKISMIVYKILPNSPIDLILSTGDDLIINIFAAIAFDADQGKYFLRESTQAGVQRRFVLDAKM